MLASRVLHFGLDREELFFECNTHFNCECVAIENSERDKGSLKTYLNRALVAVEAEPNNPRKMRLLWKAYNLICQNYTARKLTRPEDTLPAISSLMGKFSNFFGKYFAGLWEHTLISNLQWYSAHRPDLQNFIPHRTHDIAPTFSWASRTGHICYHSPNRHCVYTEKGFEPATVLDVHCTPLGNDPFGKVSSGGYITLRGIITELEVKSIGGESIFLKLRGIGGEEIYGSCDGTFDTIEDANGATASTKVICFEVERTHRKIESGERWCIYVMVLRPVEGRKGYYRRIGFCKIEIEGRSYLDPPLISKGIPEKRDITII